MILQVARVQHHETFSPSFGTMQRRFPCWQALVVAGSAVVLIVLALLAPVGPLEKQRFAVPGCHTTDCSVASPRLRIGCMKQSEAFSAVSGLWENLA